MWDFTRLLGVNICYMLLPKNSEEAEVEPFCEDLQDLLELTPKYDILFIIGDWNAKVGSQETPQNTYQSN